MRTALAAHDDVLRAAIETHGGWLFKHTGDGVCAAFASPRSAVDAAVAAQRELELPVRMGLATGEAGVQLVPVGDGLFVLLPAEVDNAPFAQAGEVDQPALDVA